MTSPGLHPEPRVAVVARLRKISDRCEHTTEKLKRQFINGELELRGLEPMKDSDWGPEIKGDWE